VGFFLISDSNFSVAPVSSFLPVGMEIVVRRAVVTSAYFEMNVMSRRTVVETWTVALTSARGALIIGRCSAGTILH